MDARERLDYLKMLIKEREDYKKLEELFNQLREYAASIGFYDCEFDESTPLADALDEVGNEIYCLRDYTEVEIEDLKTGEYY